MIPAVVSNRLKNRGEEFLQQVPAIPVQDDDAGAFHIWILAGNGTLSQRRNGKIEKLRKPKAEATRKSKGEEKEDDEKGDPRIRP